MAASTTNQELARDTWSANDDVVRLREWASDRIHALPFRSPDAITEVTLGAAEACSVRLVDPSRRLSRQHALLSRVGTRWLARDLDSTNGMRIDGVRRTEAALEPGTELGLGGVTLVAESPRRIALRGFLARILGWTSDRGALVDLALRSVRLAATQHAALALCASEGDVVPIARGLHRYAAGHDRPFVLCDPVRRDDAWHASGMTALRAAAGGSICVHAKRLPRDFAELTRALRDPAIRVQLIVCGQRPSDRMDLVSAPIELPSLARRTAELDRIVEEYADDASALLGCTRRFSAIDRAWVRAHSAASLAEIEKGTLRLVALRETGSIAGAAALLGMAHTSLGEWIGRRRANPPLDGIARPIGLADGRGKARPSTA